MRASSTSDRWRALLAFALTALGACDSHPRQAQGPPLPLDLGPIWNEFYDDYSDCRVPSRMETSCLDPRNVRDWGQVSYAGPPDGGGYCPVHVRFTEWGVVAEAMTSADLFEPAPRQVCVPDHYAVGRRHTLKVEDGYIVAYTGAFDGAAFWEDEEGIERRFITRAKLAGFARAPSGAILALGIGQARLGRGGVIALDRQERGVYVPRLVAPLPLEPSAVAFDDNGKLVMFAEGFVVRVDEDGKVENLHYFAHDLGQVASLATAPNGDVYVGVDCGVIRLKMESAGQKPARFREEWWSPMTGAGGAWTGCPAVDTNKRVVLRVLY